MQVAYLSNYSCLLFLHVFCFFSAKLINSIYKVHAFVKDSECLCIHSTCSESTQSVLIAASYIQLKHKDQVKFTSELPTLNPRILLSGPAGLVWSIFRI